MIQITTAIIAKMNFIIPTKKTFSVQEKKNIVITSNDTSADEEMSKIQDFIEAQRPENKAW